MDTHYSRLLIEINDFFFFKLQFYPLKKRNVQNAYYDCTVFAVVSVCEIHVNRTIQPQQSGYNRRFRVSVTTETFYPITIAKIDVPNFQPIK